MNNFMAMIYLVCGELELPKATIMYGLPTQNSEKPHFFQLCIKEAKLKNLAGSFVIWSYVNFGFRSCEATVAIFLPLKEER